MFDEVIEQIEKEKIGVNALSGHFDAAYDNGLQKAIDILKKANQNNHKDKYFFNPELVGFFRKRPHLGYGLFFFYKDDSEYYTINIIKDNENSDIFEIEHIFNNAKNKVLIYKGFITNHSFGVKILKNLGIIN